MKSGGKSHQTTEGKAREAQELEEKGTAKQEKGEFIIQPLNYHSENVGIH